MLSVPWAWFLALPNHQSCIKNGLCVQITFRDNLFGSGFQVLFSLLYTYCDHLVPGGTQSHGWFAFGFCCVPGAVQSGTGAMRRNTMGVCVA